MTETITPEIFDHLVQLAALELSQEESEYLRKQLNNQLKAIHELVAIPVDDIDEITMHGVSFTDKTTPATRMDIWKRNIDSEDILGQAPQIEDRYIIVPEIPHEELS
jgi:aspartyl-tRNA(Asn)/glutamyl-tRNA(Gln) amidotransferase subunit C